MASIATSIIYRNEENLKNFLSECGLRRDELSSSGRLTSILDRGILSGRALQAQGASFSASYDQHPNNSVFLNCVTTIQGVQKAIFSPAHGIMSVTMEQHNDRVLMEQMANAKEVEENYQQKLSAFASLGTNPIMQKKIREAALKDCLSRDRAFLFTLSLRAENTAVFLLDLEPTEGDYLEDPSGCHDAIRSNIPPEKIKTVLISEDWQDSSEVFSLLKNQAVRIVFVKNASLPVTFSYRNEGGIEQMKVTIKAPDFAPALNQAITQNGGRPLYVHAARL